MMSIKITIVYWCSIIGVLKQAAQLRILTGDGKNEDW